MLTALPQHQPYGPFPNRIWILPLSRVIPSSQRAEPPQKPGTFKVVVWKWLGVLGLLLAACSNSASQARDIIQPPTVTTLSTTTPTTSSLASTSTITPMTRPSELNGVEVFPGDSIQELVDAHPAGTVFVIRAGVHRNQLVNPKDGNTFVGEPGAILSGQGVTEYAFGGSADGVTIRGLIVERYANPPHTPAIRDGGGANDWLVEDNEIRENLGIGLKAGAKWRVLRNFVHHNGQLGLAGSGFGILVEGNEIAYNNTDGNNPYWEAGGAKWVYTTGLVVRDNYVHDNNGPGLWTDINNIDTLYENNMVVDNDGPGIFHEISYDAIIRNNTVKRNGFGFTGGVDGAGILVANSPNVEVYGNTVVGNNDGIAGKHADRTKNQPAPPLHGPWELRNLYVHNNTIIMTVGHNGIVDHSGGTAAWDSWGNRFQDNTYQLGSNPKYYVWKGDQRTTQEWQAFEQDTNGTWQ